jgi:hypothetical protein
MDDSARQKLRELIAKYGRSVCDNPARCHSLLADICGDHQLELNLLVSALRAGVPAKLQAAQPGVAVEMRCAQLASQLNKNQGLAEDGARWAVDSWALALGVIAAATPAKEQHRPAPQHVDAPKPLPQRAATAAKKPAPASPPKPVAAAASPRLSPRPASPQQPAAGAASAPQAAGASKPKAELGWIAIIVFLAAVFAGWEILPYLATNILGVKFDFANSIWVNVAIFIANALVCVTLLGFYTSRKQ